MLSKTAIFCVSSVFVQHWKQHEALHGTKPHRLDNAVY